MPFILNPDRRIAITSCRGNEDTANPHRQPRSRFQKGAVAVTLAQQNRIQIEFNAPGFGDQSTKLLRLPKDATTYYLVVDRRGENVLAELSVPVTLKDHYIVEWYPRIILGSIFVGPAPDSDDEGEDEGDLDIPVSPVDGG